VKQEDVKNEAVQSQSSSTHRQDIVDTEQKILKEKKRISLYDELLAMEPQSSYEELRLQSKQNLSQFQKKLEIYHRLLAMEESTPNSTARSVQHTSNSSDGSLIQINTSVQPQPEAPVLTFLQKVQQAKQRAQLTSTAGSVVDPRKKKKKPDTIGNTEKMEPMNSTNTANNLYNQMPPGSPVYPMEPSMNYNHDQYEPSNNDNSNTGDTHQIDSYSENNSNPHIKIEPNEVCNCCGRKNHITAHCPYKQHPDCNHNPNIPWGKSKNGKKWSRRQGPDILQPHLLLHGGVCRIKFPKRQDTKRELVETAYTRMMSSRDSAPYQGYQEKTTEYKPRDANSNSNSTASSLSGYVNSTSSTSNTSVPYQPTTTIVEEEELPLLQPP